jgi:hypothetical protein
MTGAEQRIREAAVHLLELAASSRDSPRLSTIAEQYTGARPVEVRLARAALSASLGVGCWREQRAEAAAKLRMGWRAG